MRVLALLLVLLTATLRSAAQTPEPPIFLLRDDGVLYMRTGTQTGEADVYIDFSRLATPPDNGEESLRFAEVFAAMGTTILSVSAPVSVAIGPDGEARMPVLRSATLDPVTGILTVRLRTAQDLILTFTGGVLTGFERADGGQPELALVYPNDLGLDDTTGLYASIDGTLVALPVKGWVYPVPTPIGEDGRIVYTSVIFEEIEGINTRIDRMVLIDTATFSVTLLVEDHVVLEGEIRPTADGSSLLYTAYSDETGAAVWKVGLDGLTPPDLLVDGLMFWADAGNFILPTFTEVTAETFTISTFGLDWSGEEPRDLGELLTYSLDGELLGTAPKPTPAP